MYKKLISAMTAAILIVTNVNAADNIKFYVTDETNNKVKISVELDDADKGKNVALYVLNPEKKEEDIFQNAYSALQYSAQKTYGENILDFEFTLSNRTQTEDKTYTYFVKTDSGKRLDGEFKYYTLEEKQEYIDNTVNEMTQNDSNGEEIIKTIYEMFNLQSFELYKNITDYQYMAQILSQNNNITINTISETFKEAAVITAFAKGGVLTDENGALLYPEYIEYDEYFKDLSESITSEGKKIFINTVIGSRDFQSCEEIKNELQKEMIAAAVYYNTKNGYGHIADILINCKNQLVIDGMNEADFENTSENVLARNLWSGQKLKYVDMIEEINTLCKPKTTEEGGSGSGNASGSGSGNISYGEKNNVASSIIVPGPASNDTLIPQNNVTFSDLNDVEWARDAIEELYEKDIVSGKEQGIFAPNDYITRAEFAIILSKAFDLQQNKKNSQFIDVQISDWFYDSVLAGESVGIIKGNGKEFMPYAKITREEIAALLVRTLIYKGCYIEVIPNSHTYSDSEQISDYAKESVEVMTAAGIIMGDTSGEFRPKDNSTRAETAVMIVKTMNFVEKNR